MPIDASTNPYDGGLDPDDLSFAGQGAAAGAAGGKGLEPDDDLEDAGKGATSGGSGTPFETGDVDKGASEVDDGTKSDFADDGGAGGDIESAGELLESELDPDGFDSKVDSGGDDEGDLFDSKVDGGDADEPGDDVKDFEFDL